MIIKRKIDNSKWEKCFCILCFNVRDWYPDLENKWNYSTAFMHTVYRRWRHEDWEYATEKYLVMKNLLSERDDV